MWQGELENPRQRLGGLGEGVLGAEHLAPILKDVRIVAFRQVEPRVQRGQFDPLSLPRAVHRPAKLEEAEDRTVDSRVQFGESLQGAAIGQFDRRSPIPVSCQAEELAQQSLPQGKKLLPQSPFHLIGRRTLPRRPLDKRLDSLQVLAQSLQLAIRRGMCQHGLPASVQEKHALCKSNVLASGAFFVSANSS
jgi:hypothetical protein